LQRPNWSDLILHRVQVMDPPRVRMEAWRMGSHRVRLLGRHVGLGSVPYDPGFT